MSCAIIALGNPLMGDDGAGPAALEHLRRLPLPTGVALLDAGTPGMGLLHILADLDCAVLLDALDFGAAPGAIRSFAPSEAQSLAPNRPLSAHAHDILQILALAERLGQCPRQIAVCAVQPAQVAPIPRLSPDVARSLPALAAEALSSMRTMLAA